MSGMGRKQTFKECLQWVESGTSSERTGGATRGAPHRVESKQLELPTPPAMSERPCHWYVVFD